MTQNGKLIFEPPGRDAPGFLRRSKRALELALELREFQNLNMQTLTQEKLVIFDKMVNFLAPFVKYPEGLDEAKEALWDASEEQFDEMLAAVQGSAGGDDSQNPTTPPEKRRRRKGSGKTSTSTSKE